MNDSNHNLAVVLLIVLFCVYLFLSGCKPINSKHIDNPTYSVDIAGTTVTNN